MALLRVRKPDGSIVDIPAIGSGSGGGLNIAGAEVGQFPQIYEVDENGVPTAWAAVTIEETNDKAAYKTIRSITIPEDVSTDTESGITWVLCNLEGKTTLPSHMVFDTDDDGRKLQLKEVYVNAIFPSDEGIEYQAFRLNRNEVTYTHAIKPGYKATWFAKLLGSTGFAFVGRGRGTSDAVGMNEEFFGRLAHVAGDTITEIRWGCAFTSNYVPAGTVITVVGR